MNNTTEEPAASTGAKTASPPEPVSTSPEQSNEELLKRQEAMVAISRRAIAPPDATVLMQDAAALLAETLGTEYSSVAEVSPDGESLCMRLTLIDTDDDESNTQVHETGTAGTDSLAGHVLQVAHPVVVNDLEEEKQFTDVFLRKHKIRSVIGVPLKRPDRSFGSLAVCSRELREFGEADVLFVETIAHLVTTTIARDQVEKVLTDERRFAAGVLQTVDALVVVLNTKWQVVRTNSACEKMTGFALEEIKDRTIWNIFPVPEQAELFRIFLEKLPDRTSPVEYESYLLTKHSQRRLIAWSFSTMIGADGTRESIIATGIDITEQREANKRAEKAEQDAREAIAELRSRDEAENQSDAEATSDKSAPVGAFGRMPIPLNAERRQHARRSYPYRQKIAAMVDGKLPDPSDFVEVQCNDIAVGGFSFLSPALPVSNTLIVTLGVPPTVTKLLAQVSHITQVEQDGEKRYLIGCAYSGHAER